MHEISVMTQIVESAIKEIKRHKLKNVDKIYLEIGELTFLAEEQLKFAYSLLTEKTILEKTKLIITKRKAKIECKRCGYKGALDYFYDDSLLMNNPTENALHSPRNVRNAKHSVVVNEYTRKRQRRFRSIHFSLPVFCCPKCEGEIKIIQGNECVIKKITGEINV